MAILHKIKAYLYENVLTKDNPNDYIARTARERSLNIKQICETAVNRAGAEMTAAAMEHATELFLKEMTYQLCNGYSVNTGYSWLAYRSAACLTARRKILINRSIASFANSTKGRS